MYQGDTTYYYCLIPNTVHHIDGYGDLRVKSYTYNDLVVFLDVIEYDTEIYCSRVTNGAAEQVEKLRLAAQEHVNLLQYELAPFLADKFVRFEEKEHDYIQNGVYTRIPEKRDYRVFKVNGLRFSAKFNRKKKYSRKDWLINMVEDEVVYPFLLFINGSVVKWSRIELLRDYDYTYLMIHGLDINEEVNFNIIEFPCNTRYGEDDDILPENECTIGMYFDKYGHITLGDDIRCRLEVIDDRIYAKYQKITAEKPYISFDGLDRNQTTIASVIAFRDGVISPEETNDLVYEGWNVYANLNPDDYGSRRYLTFYSERTMPSANHEHTPCIDVDFNRVYMQKYYGGGADHLKRLLNLSEFNFTYDRNLSFSQNVNTALDYIMSYDANLMNEAYKMETDIFVDHYTGKEVNEHSKNGIMTVSRKRCGKFDANVMIFRNGEFVSPNNIRYNNNLIDFRTFPNKENDRYEFVFATPSNAEPINIVIPNSETPLYIRSDFDVTRARLFTTEKHYLEYDVFDSDPDGRTQLEIPFTATKVDNNYYQFYLGDYRYYYGRPLTLVPDNMMRHCTITLGTSNPDTDGDYYFLLPTDFNYCHDKNHYMLFLNGTLLSKQNFSITEPSFKRPFDKLYLYITTHLEPDDILEVYYMPCELVDEVWFDTLDISGDVVVDASNISVPLSTDNYFIFVNGKKVNPEDVINISRNKLRIKNSYGSVHNVLFTRYNHSIDEIEDAFKYTGDDEWSRYIDSLTKPELDRLINNVTAIRDYGTYDYMVDHYPLSAIVSDIVGDYYVRRAGLDKTNKVFVYDFEVEAAGTDTGCDSIALNLTDSTSSDKVHFYRSNLTDKELEGLELYRSPVDNDS